MLITLAPATYQWNSYIAPPSVGKTYIFLLLLCPSLRASYKTAVSPTTRECSKIQLPILLKLFSTCVTILYCINCIL